MAILTTGNSYSDGNQITSSNLNAVVNSATFDDPVDTASGLNLTADSPPKIAINTSLSNKILTGGSLNNCPIGAVTPSTGAFTTLAASGDVNFDSGTLFVDASTDCVGIGTTAAIDTQIGGSAKLGAYDASGARIGIWGNGARWWYLHGEDSNAFQIGHRSSGNTTDFDAVTILTDGYVGIGTTSPQGPLHVVDGTATGQTANSNGHGIILDSKTDPMGMSFLADAGEKTSIFFGDTDSNDRGRIEYDHDGDKLIFRSSADTIFFEGSDERFCIKSGGNVGIGTQSPEAKLQIKTSASEVEGISVLNAGNTSEIFKVIEDGSNGGYVDIRNSSNTSIIRLNSSSDSYFNGGNLGIGTTSPANALHVVGDDEETSAINTATATSLEVAGNGTSPNSGGTILFSANSGSWKFAAIKALVQSGTEKSFGDLAFSTRPVNTDTTLTEAMRIKYNGNVGIGAASPSYKLDVNSGATNQVALFESTDATAYIELADNTGSVQFITPANGALRIATGGAGAGSVGTSGLFIDQSQNVGINDDTPSYKLDVNGTGRFVGQLTLDDEVLHNISGTQTRLPGYYAGTYGLEIEQAAQGSTIHIGRSNGNCMNVGADATAAGTDVNVVYFRDTGSGSPVAAEVGKIIINTTSTNYETSSDYRLKENEVDITDGIDRLKELKPYRFNFTRNPSKVVDGFFAHEVSPVVPESISGEKDQVDDEGNPVYQGIDQSKLVPLLTAALQEAVAKIEALEARVQTLEG